MRVILCALMGTLLISACGQDPAKEPKATAAAATKPVREAAAATPAAPTRNLPLAACLEEHEAGGEAEASQCPGFIVLALDYMIQECTAGGGLLKAVDDPQAWLLDVDHDGKEEMLVDLTQNYICYGAPGVSSCGSGGCPSFLYAHRGDAWVELGAVNAEDAPKIEVFQGEAGTPAALRGGCLGERPCSEMTHYEWNGSAYDRAWIDFNGHIVDVAAGGLWTLTKDAAVLAAPAKNAQKLDEYPTGTAMVVLGTARGKPFQFVSPCNACRRGFVETAALTQ